MEKLKNSELTSILINVLYVKLLIAILRNIILLAGSGGWILSIYLTCIMLLIFYGVGKVYDFSKPIYQIKNNFLRIFMGLTITFFLLFSMFSIAKIYPETVKIILLKNTPIEIIFLIFIVVCTIGARLGIQAIGTICSLFQPIAAAVMIFCFLFLIPHMDIRNIMPVLGRGAKDIFINGLPALSSFADVFIIFILAPLTQNPEKAIKSGYKAIITMGIITTITLLTYSLVYPYGISENFILPLYQLVRLIQVGDFFGRFEAFFELVWSISIMLYFSIYLYVISIVWMHTFKLKYHKPFIAPFMIIVSIIVYASGSYVDKVKNYVWYSLILCGLWVLATVAGIIIQKKEVKR